MGRVRVLAAVAITVALAGCGSGGSSSSASVQDKPSVTATLNWAQRACEGTSGVFDQVAGPLKGQDAAGVATAGQMAKAVESMISNLTAASEYPPVIEYADGVLGIIAAMGHNAVAVEDYGEPWWSVTAGDATLASSFRSLELACSAAGVTIHGGGSPVAGPSVQPGQSVAAVPTQSAEASPVPAYTPSTDPLNVGCPTSRQLLVAWNAAPATARHSWFRGMAPTGFFGTECWHQWIVTNPVVQANGPVVFTDTGGQLSLLPQTGLSELDTAICGIPGAPSDQWAGPGGPAMCP